MRYRSNHSIVVLVEEEYGYRTWIWLTGMSAEELKAWWSTKKTVNAFFYDGPVSFPGEVHRIYHESVHMREIMEMAASREGEESEHFTNDETEFYLAEEGEGRTIIPVSEKLKLPEDHWYMHLHTDNDSYMTTADGEVIKHEGWVSDEEYFSDDYEPCQEAVDESNKAMCNFMNKIIEEQTGDQDEDNSNDRDSEEYN